MYRILSAALLGWGNYSVCGEKERDLRVLDHPAKDLLLSKIRSEQTNRENFVRYSHRLLRLLLEYTFGLEPFSTKTGRTPTGAQFQECELKHAGNYCIVLILRAALSMVGETLYTMPDIHTGFVLIQRDEESPGKEPKFYYAKLPKNIEEMRILLVDPMLASGGSSALAIEKLKSYGVKEENIVFINLISSKTGVDSIFEKHPRIRLVTAAIDPLINEDKFIIPGLGDFGDRYFGTE